MEQLPTILAGIILAAILWVMKGTADNGKAIAVLQSTMDGTVLPELGRLREGAHQTRTTAQTAVSKVDVLEQRAARNEREIEHLWGADRRSGEDRRAGEDRRESA